MYRLVVYVQVALLYGAAGVLLLGAMVTIERPLAAAGLALMAAGLRSAAAVIARTALPPRASTPEPETA